MFRTTLKVSHVDGNRWELLAPLVYEGTSQYFVIRSGFETDFASIPKPVRWLLDSAGQNSEAAVLHDAVWRESKRETEPRVDPWHADGLFRRALRETGAPALTRGLMWFAVRLAATVSGRFGRLGPSLFVKVLQLLGIFVLGVVAALGPTLVALVGLVVYWIANWVVALVWQFYERGRMRESPNWPWPLDRKPRRLKQPMPRELLAIVDKQTVGGAFVPDPTMERLLTETPDPVDADLDPLIGPPEQRPSRPM
jgi:hypothetical protein